MQTIKTNNTERQKSSRLTKAAPFSPQQAKHRRKLQALGHRDSSKDKSLGRDKKVKCSGSNSGKPEFVSPVSSFVWSPPVVPSQPAPSTPHTGPVESCPQVQTAAAHIDKSRVEGSPRQRPGIISPRETNATDAQIPAVVLPNNAAQYSDICVPTIRALSKRNKDKIQSSRRIPTPVIPPTLDKGKCNTMLQSETNPQISGSPTVMGPPPAFPRRPKSSYFASENRESISRPTSSGIHQFLQFQCNLARATKNASDEDWKRFVSTYFSTDIKLLLSHTEKTTHNTMSSVLHFQDIPQYYKAQYDAGVVQMQFMFSQLNEHCLYDSCHVVSDHFTMNQHYETGRLVQFEGSLHARFSKDLFMEILIFRFNHHCEYIDMASLPIIPNDQDPSGDDLIFVPKSTINEYGLHPAVFQLLGAGAILFTESQPSTAQISDTAELNFDSTDPGANVQSIICD